jgi:hypothetical protein
MNISPSPSLYFEKIFGIMQNFIVIVDPIITKIEMDYPNNIEKAIKLNTLRLLFEINNYLGFDAVFTAEMYSINTKTGEQSSIIPIREDVRGATRANTPILVALDIPVDDPRFMNIAPDEIYMDNAQFHIINEAGDLGFAEVGTAFNGNYISMVLFDFYFVEDEPIYPEEVTEVEVSDDNRENIEKYVENVTINLEVQNSYSMGGRIFFYFCSSPLDSLIYQSDNDIRQGFGRVALINSESGGFGYRVLSGEHSSQGIQRYQFQISKRNLPIFYQYNPLYYGFKIHFDEGEAIIRPEETIRVVGYLTLDLQIKF